MPLQLICSTQTDKIPDVLHPNDADYVRTSVICSTGPSSRPDTELTTNKRLQHMKTPLANTGISPMNNVLVDEKTQQTEVLCWHRWSKLREVEDPPRGPSVPLCGPGLTRQAPRPICVSLLVVPTTNTVLADTRGAVKATLEMARQEQGGKLSPHVWLISEMLES